MGMEEEGEGAPLLCMECRWSWWEDGGGERCFLSPELGERRPNELGPGAVRQMDCALCSTSCARLSAFGPRMVPRALPARVRTMVAKGKKAL